MKSQFTEALSLGDTIQDVFVVSRIALGQYERGEYLRLRLADRTGKISAVMWSGAAEAYRSIRSGELAWVEGRVESYRGELQVKVSRLSRVPFDEGIDSGDFLPRSRFSPEELRQRLSIVVSQVGDDSCRRLLEALLADEEMMDKFSRAPGGKTWHHAYVGGLLEHTLSVVELCRLVAPLYPGVKVDLLTTGAVFHDLGKTRELTYDIALDYATEGRLVGHVVMSYDLVRHYAAQVEGFPEDSLLYLEHMILSHHGEIERSPVLPMTLEACLLHYLDNMDAQMMATINEMEKVRDLGREWTEYIKLLGRPLFVGALGGMRREA